MHQSIALDELYIFAFQLNSIGLSVRLENHENDRGSETLSRIFGTLPSNAWSDQLGVKRYLIEHSKSYRLISKTFKFVEKERICLKFTKMTSFRPTCTNTKIFKKN